MIVNSKRKYSDAVIEKINLASGVF